jgi:hypothetical protein
MMANEKFIPDDLMVNVMAKIVDILCNGDGKVVPKSDSNFLTWCSPGIPFEEDDFDFLTQGVSGVYKPQIITNPDGTQTEKVLSDAELSQALASDTNKMYLQAEQLARLVDIVPDTSGIDDSNARLNIKNNNGALSDVYGETLVFSQVADTPLTADEVAKIAKFRELLQVKREKVDKVTDEKTWVTEASPLVNTYFEKMSEWQDAAREFNSAKADALSGSTPAAIHNFALNAKILESKVAFKMRDWITNGYKLEYEGIAARMDQIMSRDLTLLKAQYKEVFESSKIRGLFAGVDFHATTLVPASFAKSKGWTKFTFTNADNKHYQNNSTNTASVSAGGLLSAVALMGSGSGSVSQGKVTVDRSSFALSFEICEVPIVRPWFKSNFLTSKTWRFAQGDQGFKDKFLSDGMRPPHVDSMLPAIPTALVFIRNLKITTKNSKDISTAIKTAAAAGGGVSAGLFSLGGTVSTSGREKTRSHTADGQSITIQGMQCIGFKCHLLPKAPNPDPTITKWV